MEAHFLFHLALVSAPAQQRKRPAPELQKMLENLVHRPRPHSTRSDTSGSTFVARHAGMKQASSAITDSNSDTATNVSGSVALTPNSSVFINRVSAKAEVSPIATPAAASFPPCETTNFNTSPVCAPRAILTPISRVRCATEKLITP